MPEIGTVSVEPVPLPAVGSIPTLGVLQIETPVTRDLAPPVVVQLGFPVTEMPGCVAVHPDAKLNPSLLEDDPGRVGMFCPDGQLPAFNPLDYTPGQYVPIKEKVAKPKDEAKEEKPAAAKRPTIPELPKRNETPPQATEPPPASKPVIEKIADGLPALETVVTTATIAVVATSSALVAKPFADLILKTIKPTIKKVMTRIAKIRGKTVRPESVWERRVSQRERNLAIRTLRQALKP